MAMHGVELFRTSQQLLAIVVRESASSESKYNFLTEQSEPLQLGVNFYRAGEAIESHTHLPRDIQIDRVQEVLVIGEGKTRLTLYDDDRRQVAETVLSKGDLVLLLSGGHGFEILEDTKILEIKQGPYDGKKQDKVPFSEPG
jgi:cupin fold WbuC family metalloprotein